MKISSKKFVPNFVIIRGFKWLHVWRKIVILVVQRSSNSTGFHCNLSQKKLKQSFDSVPQYGPQYGPQCFLMDMRTRYERSYTENLAYAGYTRIFITYLQNLDSKWCRGPCND